MAKSQVITGARAVFKVNGNKVAYASNCSYNWNYNHQPVEAISDPGVLEHTPLGSTVDFTCNMFRVLSKGPAAMKFHTSLEQFLAQDTLTVDIYDVKSAGAESTAVLHIGDVKMTSRAGTVDARGVWTETISFVGIAINDEFGA